MNENKKELNDNEVEKVSGGINNNQQFIKIKGFKPQRTHLAYGGPDPRKFDKILKIIKKEQNKDKEEPEKGKLSE